MALRYHGGQARPGPAWPCPAGTGMPSPDPSSPDDVTMRFRFIEDQEVTLFTAIPVGIAAAIVTTLFKEALDASGS
ncbi:hypothetical protein ACU4GD_44525 [Cupriavidus basilensis]